MVLCFRLDIMQILKELKESGVAIDTFDIS